MKCSDDFLGIDTRVRVLLVEDDAGDALLTMERLERAPGAPFDVWHESALAAAQDRADAALPDVVLLDLDLPDSRGLASLQGLRRALPQVPVIVLTGADDDALGIAALQEGAQDFLAKSRIDATALRRACLWAVERRRRDEVARRALEAAPVALVVVDDDGRVLSANRAAARLLDTTPRQLVGEPFDLVPVDGAVAELTVDIPGRRPLRVESHTAALSPESVGRWIVRLEPLRRAAAGGVSTPSDDVSAFEALASAAADRVNQDLTTLRAHLDRWAGCASDATMRERAAPMLDAVDRLTAFTRRLALLGEPPRALVVRVEMRGLLEDLVDAAREAADRDVTVALDAPPTLAATSADPLHVCAALLELIAGAVARVPDGGTVQVSARDVVAPHGRRADATRRVRITIADRGAPLGDEVFDGDVTRPVLRHGRDARLDVPLGFAASLVRAGGGSVRCFSAAGFGTRINVYLAAWESE